MNTRIVFPLAAVPLVALGLLTTSMADVNLADAPVSARITDFPIVTVRPAPQDVAYYRAHRIVDLPRITVRPEPADLALFLADNTAHVIHLPALLPQASVLDGRMDVVSNALAAL
ncbi:MAG TPA: hypothetical protein VF471_13615 [Pseudoxanthomonas sp.]